MHVFRENKYKDKNVNYNNKDDIHDPHFNNYQFLAKFIEYVLLF